MKKMILTGALATALLVVTSCGTPQNITYFQDFAYRADSNIVLQNKVITVKPTDKIYIGVKTKDEQISKLFNLSGSGTSVGSGVSQNAYYYTVDSHGDIDFPILGKIHVEGMAREDIATTVKSKLIEASLVKDPTVTVALANLHYSVIGEVSHPGQFDLDDEKLTIIDAISKAGDLTIQGCREDVMVLRRENGHQKVYKVDLCSGYNIVNSPAYYIQQNDVVYVTPNDAKKRSSTVNGNTVLTPSFWMSVASMLMTVVTFLKVK